MCLPDVLFLGFTGTVLDCEMQASTKFGGNMFLTKSMSVSVVVTLRWFETGLSALLFLPG